MDLILERREQGDETAVFSTSDGATILAAPLVDDDYWQYRVRLSDEQAIVGFPKFGMVGIGFAVEEDWNTNLPSRVPAEQIFAHIRHNKGSEAIKDEDCLTAIRLIQDAVQADSGGERA